MIYSLGLNNCACISPWGDDFFESQPKKFEYFSMPPRHEGLDSILLDVMGEAA